MRVTDMRGVDVSRYRFDFDLTFAALTLDADGRVYHRYGGRDQRSASHWISDASFAAMLEASLATHAQRRPTEDGEARPETEERSPLLPERIPAFARRDKGECIHCHNVHEGLHDEARSQGSWKPDDIWVYPEPARLGLDLAREDQRRVIEVLADSPAAAAGVEIGDLLLRLGPVPIATASDLMFAADALPPEGGQVPLRIRRGEELREVWLPLEPGWKRGTSESFAWRALKWTLEPVPGFGGPALTPEELRALGLADERFAFRIQYFVTWGPRAAYGRAAARAGLREGDVVLEVAGKREFQSVDHFHAWWRLTRRAGEVVPVHVLRGEQRLELELRVRARGDAGG